MSLAAPVPLKFQIGARTLWSVRRRLVRLPLSLDDALGGAVPILPPLREADGYVVTSLPAESLAQLSAAHPGLLPIVRQRYTRYYVDLSAGFDAWWAGLSGNARSGLKRKAKRLAPLDVRAYRSADELLEFHRIARAISATTYQEKLLDAGLPDTPEFRARMLADSASGRARGWLLFIAGDPAAYLYCPVRGRTVIYEYLGHDPRFADRSPGSVLQVEALRGLFEEGAFDRFDFTEGEGQHKRGLASGGVACVDLLLLRPSLRNRAAVAGLRLFDRVIATGKDVIAAMGLSRFAKVVRRG